MGHSLHVQGGAFLLAGLGLLLLPLQWCMAMLLAAAVHELAHLAAVRCFGGQMVDLVITPFGARMTVLPMPPIPEACCALAGPLGSFAMLIFASVFSELALCAAVQGLYNLLPVYPLDGGRIAQALLPEGVCKVLKFLTISGISLVCVWLFWRTDRNPVWLLPVGILWWHGIQRKFPCKESKQAVQ